ncbi:MAG: hypothetical protein OEY49_13915 [Candidatus Heimdallarchaeota archaeon]|nr:hypothetical protein [Candidatus Heimdallarchaeota archaeon]
MNKLIYIIITLLITSNSSVSALTYSNTTFNFVLQDGSTYSSIYQVSIINTPETSENYGYIIKLGNSGLSNSFTQQGAIEFNTNIINITQNIEIQLSYGSTTNILYNHTIPDGVWFHYKHVFANWTLGFDPPQDGRGFGIGTLIDVEIMNNLITDSGITTVEMVERLLNLILGGQIDYNEDGFVQDMSDGFGFLKYTVGMRNHFSNAVNSPDASSSFVALAQPYIEQLNALIDNRNFDIISNITHSDSLIAQIYNSSMQVLFESNISRVSDLLSDLNDNISIFSQSMGDIYSQIKNIAYDITFVVNEEFSTDDNTPFNWLVLSITIISFTGLKRKLRKDR